MNRVDVTAEASHRRGEDGDGDISRIADDVGVPLELGSRRAGSASSQLGAAP